MFYTKLQFPDEWERIADLPQKLHSARMEILDGVPTVFGGYNGKQQNEKLYQYNYRKNKWTAHPDIKLNTPRMSPAVFQVPKYLFDHIPCSNPDSDEEIPESTSCNTIATRDTESKPCIFPFIADGKVYNGCGRRNDKYYCATRVDEEGVFLEWEECNPRCPKDIGTDSNACLTLATRDTEALPCEFPFTAEDGLSYDSCIKIDGIYQCATRKDRDGFMLESGECNEFCPKDLCMTKATRDSEAQPCIFPFTTEDGQEYDTCTQIDGMLQCATKLDRDGILQESGECNEKCPQPGCMTKGTRDAEAQPCIFPFTTEDGQEHETCTEIDGIPQCATKLDRDGILQESGECEDTCPKPACMTKGTRDSEPQPCIFPFTTEDGQEYDTCTQIDGILQCATQLDRDGILQESGECDTGCPKQVCMTKGTRDSEPQPCIFPFTAENDQSYDGCASIDGTYQCATKLDRDGYLLEGGECDTGCKIAPGQNSELGESNDLVVRQDDSLSQCETVDSKSCIFPFKASNGKTYETCANIKGKFYCATKVDSQGLGQAYGICSSLCFANGDDINKKQCETNDSKSCIFPFKASNGKTYETCADIRGRFYCATKVDSDGLGQDYGICSSECFD